jgi:cytochrome c peroxidase
LICLTVATGCAAPAAAPPQMAPLAAARCLDGLPLSAAECARVSELALPDALPPAAGNRFADDERAAYFGFLAFYDRRFSNVADVSCATCHLPESSFADGKTVSEVVAGHPLTRNAPSLLNAAATKRSPAGCPTSATRAASRQRASPATRPTTAWRRRTSVTSTA